MTVLGGEPGPLRAGLSLTDPTPDFALGIARAAEAAGLDTLQVGDSTDGADSFTLLAALAVSTERIGLVSAVAGWTRTPSITAQIVHTLSSLSGGRMTVGMGPLPRARILGWHGMEFDPVIPRFREYIQTLAACLDATEENPTDISGEYYSSHGWPGLRIDTVRRSPIVLAATQRRMTTLAGEIADGVIFNSMLPLGFIAGEGRQYLETGMARSGRSPEAFTIGVGRITGIHDDHDRAYDLARHAMAVYMEVPYFHTVMRAVGFDAELERGERAAHDKDYAGVLAAITDEMVDAVAIAGTPDEALAKMRRYAGVVDLISLGTGPNVVPMAERKAQSKLVIDILAELKKA